jgi:hypothetical protein
MAPGRIATIFFAGSLALGLFLLIAAGPAPQLLFPSDDAAYLDACHRAALGQWMGRDFSSPIGPAALLPIVLAMKFRGATVNALALGSALSWLVYGGLTWLTVRPRMPAGIAAVFALLVAATAAAPYTLDFGSWQILSYAMLYNRLAWAALGIAAGAALLPRTDGATAQLVPVGLGACAVWLWALKPNYLAILAPLVLYHWTLQPGWRSWLMRAVFGALGMLFLIWICVRFSPLGYIENHLTMARNAQAGTVSYAPIRMLRENSWLMLGLGLLWGIALKAPGPVPRRGRLGFAFAAVVVCTMIANLTNNQFSEIPLWGALGWLGAVLAIGAKPISAMGRIALLAGAAYGLAFTWQPLAGIAYSFAWKHYRAPGTPPAVEVTGAAWHGMPMRPVPGEPIGPAERLESAGNYAAWLNDGLALLFRVQPSPGTVLCLDWTNPFPFATSTTPAIGDEIAWHVGRYINESNHPDAARLLAAATVVMEPRRSLQPDSLVFKRALFASGLQASFVIGGETAHWRAWVRREPASPSVKP